MTAWHLLHRYGSSIIALAILFFFFFSFPSKGNNNFLQRPALCKRGCSRNAFKTSSPLAFVRLGFCFSFSSAACSSLSNDDWIQTTNLEIGSAVRFAIPTNARKLLLRVYIYSKLRSLVFILAVRSQLKIQQGTKFEEWTPNARRNRFK